MTEKGKREKVLEINKNIETNLNEITNIENYISQIISDDSFDKLDNLTNQKSKNRTYFKYEENYYDFISLDLDSLAEYKDTISEKEFFKIVEANNKRIFKTSGKYQQSLYSHYKQAKEENDEGYISDIFKKAIILKNNMNKVKQLQKNKFFMKEWRKNVGRINPITELKKTGNMRKIEIIKELTEKKETI